MADRPFRVKGGGQLRFAASEKADAARLVTSIGDPAEDVIRDGKPFRGRALEFRLEGKGVSFERHGEMDSGLHEALYE